MADPIVALLAAGMLVAAFSYASVGHGGASAYLAALALAGVAPAEMRPIALSLNILVAVAGARGVEALVGEDPGQRAPDPVLVVDHEDARQRPLRDGASPVIAEMRSDTAAISFPQAVWAVGPRYSTYSSRKAAASSSWRRGETVTMGRGNVSTEASAEISSATWGSRMPKVSTRVPK